VPVVYRTIPTSSHTNDMTSTSNTDSPVFGSIGAWYNRDSSPNLGGPYTTLSDASYNAESSAASTPAAIPTPAFPGWPIPWEENTSWAANAHNAAMDALLELATACHPLCDYNIT